MNEGRYSDARASISEVPLGRLSPYEHGMTALLLSSISKTEGNPVAERDHLLNALAARGLNADQTRLVLDRIRALDARLPVEPQ